VSLVHWDDVEGERFAVGHIDATWHDLGSAAGSRRIGVNRVRIEPGAWPTPAHRENAEEEISFVLSGSGLSWQDGVVYEVRAGDCLVHLAGREAHTLRAGADGLEVLAFGERHPAGTTLPRAGVSWLGGSWVESGLGEHPFAREAAAGPPEVGEPEARPPRIASAEEVRWEDFGREDGRVQSWRRELGRAAGCERAGLRMWRVAPGKLGCPAHCHSAEEELFVVLDGAGTLELGEERLAVGRGHVVSRPAGTGIAHAFAAGEPGLTYLAFSNRVPGDMAYYPRSNKINFRSIGVIGRIERLDYWDGE
jgi:uncharacterized cupin superfamily protein